MVRGLPKITSAEWLHGKDSRTVVDALTAEGTEVRFVGGCVRNALLGEPVTDIDLATPDEPQTVIRLLDAAGIRAVPSGIDHGTITAVTQGRHYEITTLRHDVETFGRKAQVAFQADWEADARRRDFTINALYADPNGKIFDPLRGFSDIRARRVRFIGDAGERIREDYLRILRFFRIYAWYGEGALDAEGLEAAKAHLAGLDHLSAERIRDEIFKLLAAPRALSTLEAMDDAGVLAHVLPEATAFQRYAGCVRLEEALFGAADPLRRLGALVEVDADGATALGQRLRLSNKQTKRLSAMMAETPRIHIHMGRQPIRSAVYWHGKEAITDRILLAWAGGKGDPRTVSWGGIFREAWEWQVPEFPLSGRDVMDLGVPKGVEVGKILRELELWWVDAGFPAPSVLRARLKEAVGAGI